MGGKVPFSVLLASSRSNKAGNAAPSPQDGGIPPMQSSRRSSVSLHLDKLNDEIASACLTKSHNLHTNDKSLSFLCITATN